MMYEFFVWSLSILGVFALLGWVAEHLLEEFFPNDGE